MTRSLEVFPGVSVLFVWALGKAECALATVLSLGEMMKPSLFLQLSPPLLHFHALFLAQIRKASYATQFSSHLKQSLVSARV